jgi:hypothetical protein
MELTYNWIIVQLDTKPQAEGLQDVVSTVHWRRNITDGGTFIAESYGSMGCPTPSSTDFTAYEDLTKEQVEAWLIDGLDVQAIDTELLIQLDNLKNPPIIVLPLPWINIEE